MNEKILANWNQQAEVPGDVVVKVTDTGTGIAPDELPFIFDRYRRARGSRTHEGTGLGLFIVKILVEAHGGRVEVRSVLGSGSCFSVFLPAVAAVATDLDRSARSA